MPPSMCMPLPFKLEAPLAKVVVNISSIGCTKVLFNNRGPLHFFIEVRGQLYGQLLYILLFASSMLVSWLLLSHQHLQLGI